MCTAGIGKAIAREFLRSVGVDAVSCVCLQLWRQNMCGSVVRFSREAYANVHCNVSCLVSFCFTSCFFSLGCSQCAQFCTACHNAFDVTACRSGDKVFITSRTVAGVQSVVADMRAEVRIVYDAPDHVLHADCFCETTGVEQLLHAVFVQNAFISWQFVYLLTA